MNYDHIHPPPSARSLLADIHAIFLPTYRLQVCSSTIVFCTSAVNILLTINDDLMYSLRFLCYMLASIFQLLFWCWAGQRTYDMSMQINRAAYTANWLDMNPRLRRKLGLVLMRTQTALFFSARPFYVLNYESFAAVRANGRVSQRSPRRLGTFATCPRGHNTDASLCRCRY